MKVPVSILSLAALATFELAGSAQAHHSVQMFDLQKEIQVTGTVKEFQYTNPHSWLIVDVENKDGSVTTWGFEAEGPGILMRAGIMRNSLPPGTKVTVTSHPMKDGRPAGTWIKLVTAEGKEMVPRVQQQR